VARGSLEETISYLVFAAEMHFLPEKLSDEILQQADQLVQIINGYIAYLKRTKQGDTDQSSAKVVHEEAAMYDPDDAEDDLHTNSPSANQTALDSQISTLSDTE
jgi:hypothetical protein